MQHVSPSFLAHGMTGGLTFQNGHLPCPKRSGVGNLLLCVT